MSDLLEEGVWLTKTRVAGEVATAKKKLRLPVADRRRMLLVVHSPDAEAVGRAIELDGEVSVTFGREVDGPGAVRDPQMSRSHARVSFDGELSTIEDLGSSNGTSVDGMLLQGPIALESGAVIGLGETLVIVDEEPARSALPFAAESDGSKISELAGISMAALRMRQSIATVAVSRGSVLILGPTGAGKELAARAIHDHGPRARGPFVPVNCAAIPAELAESELFGHTKGSFTGASSDRDGVFVQASGGTIFLDEVGELAPALQAKLLRVLEDRTVRPIGASAARPVDVRVIAATNSSLSEDSFRRDLYARLGDWVLRLPGLAERRADILELWRHFVPLEGGTALLGAEVASALLLYRWPMNVRELRSLARRMATLSPAGLYDPALLPEEIQQAARGEIATPPPALERSRIKPTKETIEAALRSAGGNVKQAADACGVHRGHFYRWLRRFQLNPEDYR